MSTQAEVEVSYDVSNEFFRLWLDERMNYTCGVYEGTDNLEEAQVKKLDWIHDAAHLSPEKRHLDIGCGWGACIEHMTTAKGVKSSTGITLAAPSTRRSSGARSPGSAPRWSPTRTSSPSTSSTPSPPSA